MEYVNASYLRGECSTQVTRVSMAPTMKPTTCTATEGGLPAVNAVARDHVASVVTATVLKVCWFVTFLYTTTNESVSRPSSVIWNASANTTLKYDHNSVIGCVTAKPEFEYGLKLINPARLSHCDISGRAHCSTLSDLKEFIRAKFPINRPLELPNLNLVDFGYIEAGHGAKDRKIWLYDDDDVAKMYFDHKGKRKILLWCYTGLGSKKKERETLII